MTSFPTPRLNLTRQIVVSGQKRNVIINESTRSLNKHIDTEDKGTVVIRDGASNYKTQTTKALPRFRALLLTPLHEKKPR